MIILVLMFVSQSMFLIIAVFLCGYCFDYYSFEIFKYKNQKSDIIDFFSSYNKKYGSKHGSFDRKKCRTLKLKTIFFLKTIYLLNKSF